MARLAAGLAEPVFPAEPRRDCNLCPRLTAFRSAANETLPDGFNGAVPSFGADDARLLVVGLAPGMMGANRTGRPFTGDHAGLLLYDALVKFGFASGQYAARVDDGLRLRAAMITNAVRCVPPANKPTPAEIATCRAFLRARISALPRLRAILSLGRIAHESSLRALGARPGAHAFRHGAVHHIEPDRPAARPIVLFDSYHCSRYNTNTGRLTPAMFEDVFAAIRAFIDRPET